MAMCRQTVLLKGSAELPTEAFMNQSYPRKRSRIAWADHAKGICIILVVMLYAVEHVIAEVRTAGWLEPVVEFARPFRMPDFFFVSGVLLTLAVHRDWRTFLDRKVAHFAYFYALWLTILVAFASPWLAERLGWHGVGALYIKSFYHPYSMLWFIYLLPIFFVLTKALRHASPALVWTMAAALQVAGMETGVKVLDKFAAYYVFFYSGYTLAPHVLRFADAVTAKPWRALALLALWAALDAYLVKTARADLPALSLVLALAGAAAVIASSALMVRAPFIFAPVAYCGRNTLAIYLAFAIPLAVVAKLLFSVGWIEEPGTIAALITVGAVAGALVLRLVASNTAFAFLFERPAWLALAGGRSARPARMPA